MYHHLMKHQEYFAQYHGYFHQLLTEYFENDRFQVTLRQTERMIAPYVKQDPTAFCSFEDHQLAVATLEQAGLLRAKSIRGQLEGSIPATIRGQLEHPDARIDASGIRLEDLGDFEDLEAAKGKD
ncbi:MAG: CotH kinase family protein [Lachnospiraceae bacterium]